MVLSRFRAKASHAQIERSAARIAGALLSLLALFWSTIEIIISAKNRKTPSRGARGWVMQIQVKLRRCFVRLVMGAFLVECTYGQGLSGAPMASTNGNGQTGRVLGVRNVLRNPPDSPNSLYPQTHYYDLCFSVRVSDQTYCAEYTTPVLDEIDDLSASNGHRGYPQEK